MIERKYVTIETPITKTKVEIKEWLTGKEFEESELPKGLKAQINIGGEQKIADVDMADIHQQQRHMQLKAWIQSVNGSTENILDTLLELPMSDYLYVESKVNEVYVNQKKMTS